MKRMITGIAAVVMAGVITMPAFGAVYKKTEERYPQGNCMIVLDTPGNGSYALGVKEKL